MEKRHSSEQEKRNTPKGRKAAVKQVITREEVWEDQCPAMLCKAKEGRNERAAT